MKTLYEASNAAEAHMLVDFLGQHGILAHIEGEHLQGAAGGLPAFGLIRLVVNEDEFTSARELIKGWESSELTKLPPKEKSRRPFGWLWGLIFGLVVGAGGLHAAYRVPAMVDGIDYNRDGLLDERWTFSIDGRPLKMEADRNLDHKIDYIVSYDIRGRIESAVADDDFNGVFESKTKFRNGNAVFSETDTDADGYPDLRTFYKSGVVDYVEYIKPTSGLPFRVEHFTLGILRFADVDSDEDGRLETRIIYNAKGDISRRGPIPNGP